MQEATQGALTFALLDARNEALPEGTVSTLRSPRWTRSWTFVGLAGMALQNNGAKCTYLEHS